MGESRGCLPQVDTAAALGSEAISVHYLGNRGEHGTMSTSNGYDGTVRPPLQASWPRASDPDALRSLTPLSASASTMPRPRAWR